MYSVAEPVSLYVRWPYEYTYTEATCMLGVVESSRGSISLMYGMIIAHKLIICNRHKGDTYF